MVIIVPSADFDEDFAPPIADPAHVSFPVRARNLSRSGLSFLTPRDVLPRIITDDAVPIYIDEFLKLERLVFVGMEVIGKGNLWLKAKVARFRPSHDGLFECGLQFLAKTTGPQHE